MDWRPGSSGRAPAFQVQSSEFKLQSHKKKNSNSVTLWKWQTMVQWQDHCQEFEEERDEWWDTEDFRAVTLVCDTHWWVHVIIHLSELVGCMPGVNSNIKDGLQAAVVCQFRFVTWNQCAMTYKTCCGRRTGLCTVGGRGWQEFSPPAQFYCEPKSALK
jgi:hypothetical protein